MNLRHWLLMCCLGWSVVCGVPKHIVYGQSGESPAVLSDSSATALGHAEALLEAARAGKLTDAGAAQAADLLNHEDPFVRGIAEWAIATKVQRENGGTVAVWPGEDPPAWYRQWVQLDGGFLLDVDYVRQGAAWDIHRDGRKMQASLVKIIRRATGAAAEVEAGGEAEETRLSVNRRLAELRSIQDRLDSLVEAGPSATTAMRKLWLEARYTARPIVLANPAIDFDSLVFVTRHSGTFANITGSQYPWTHKPGGDMCVQSGLSPDSPVATMCSGCAGNSPRRTSMKSDWTAAACAS